MYFVYIIYSQRIDKFYIGFSSNVQERLIKHNRNSKSFSSSGKPWILMYSEEFHSKKDAIIREKQLKKWKSRVRIESLIKAGSEHPDFKSGGSVPP